MELNIVIFFHPHNKSWLTERCVEIPIALSYVKGRCLEVGNVLNRYAPFGAYKPFKHDVLDKYEIGKNILNKDIVDFNPGPIYDSIISVSTIEHVGFDETPREPKKALRALEHMKSMLRPNGIMILTVPIGYNIYLDSHLPEFGAKYLRRTGISEWREITDIVGIKYDTPYKCANGLAIIEISA